MGLQDIVSWYQKKIGTYDKQQWEKTVEQRILHGLKHVLKRTAKLKADFIDVDLVRGSSFPKAKPKHGLVTVTRLALIRWLFLPIYYKWWIKQTCLSVYCFLLLLYVLQCLNLSLYFYYYSDAFEHTSSYEVLVPATMMLVLSVIHSEIVATSDAIHQRSSEGSGCHRDRIAIKRSRRTKPRIKSRHPSCDSNAELPETLNPSSLRSQSDNKNIVGVRRRNVVWGTPQREIPLVASPAAGDDDGFESLNSNGSSEDTPSCSGNKNQPQVHDADGNAVNAVNTHEQANYWPGLQSTCRRRSGQICTPNCETCDPETDHKDTDSEEIDSEEPTRSRNNNRSASPERSRILHRRRGSSSLQIQQQHVVSASSCDSDVEQDGPANLTEATTSAAEWLGITTNSEECSVNSDVDDSTGSRTVEDHPFAWEFQMSPSMVLSPSCASSDRVSCTIWEKHDMQRADLSVLDISSAIIARVESMPENMDYFYAGLCVSLLVAFLPSLCRLIEISDDVSTPEIIVHSLPMASVESVFQRFLTFAPQLLDVMFGDTLCQRVVIFIAILERFFLSATFFFLIAVAERTFKQRFLYAKLFSHLTSFRRARKSELPHFRLNKVRNIKTWLSIRSYLKRRGPQRSVDVIVSAAFIITLLLVSFLSVELLKDSVRLHSEYNLEALLWCLVLGVFLLRFMTLGNKTNRKYRNLSVLLTEQINLYLQIEQKPNKKEELMVANSVLKLAADLLKELESPFKISGLSANPYVYTITKVVILSALSGVLSEMLGFKLKLHKIKIK